MGNKLGQYLTAEISATEEKVHAPPPDVERFLSEHASSIEAIRSRLLACDEIAWESDVERGTDAPIPDALGHIRLQRLLIVEAMLAEKSNDPDTALDWLEASWRLNSALSSRPEFVPQIIAAAAAKLQVGALRKVDSPTMEWSQRLRRPDLLNGFLAALENERWFSAARSTSGIEDEVRPWEITEKFLRQISTVDLCAWSPSEFDRFQAIAVEGESEANQIFAGILLPNHMNALGRWPRSRLEAELTALVLDARGERAASRRRLWPARLLNLESETCPAKRFSYRRNPDGTVTISFEGPPLAFEPSGLQLPLSFTAGTPAAPKRPLTGSGAPRTLPSS